VDGLWATKREDVGLIVVQLVSKISNLCDPDPPTLQTDRLTDGQTTCNLNTALCTKVHRAVKKWRYSNRSGLPILRLRRAKILG